MKPGLESSKSIEWLLAALVAGVACVVYGWIAAGGIGTVGFSDSADYLLFADYYRGEYFARTQTSQAVEHYRTTRFPPLFPLLLAAFGGGADAVERAQWVSFASVIAMLALLWAWLRRQTRTPWATGAITLMVVLTPGLFLLVLSPVSEPIAMALMWLVFLLASRTERSTQLILLLAAIAGLSTLARSINVALVAAIPIWLALHRIPMRVGIGATACACIPFLAWLVHRRSMPDAQSYFDAIEPQHLIAQLGGWPEMLYAQPWTVFRGLARNLDHDPGGVALALASIVLVFALIGWWRRLRARELDAVFLLLYVGVILAWPYPREAPRFVTFVLPLLYFHAWLGLRACASSQIAERGARLAATAALTMVFAIGSGPSILHFIDLATQRLDPELRPEMRTQLYFHTPDRSAAARAAEANARLRFAAREVVRRVPPGNCVYATLPYVLRMQGEIRVLRYPWSFVDGVSVEEQLRRCDYFFVAGMKGDVTGHRPFHPSAQLQGWTSPVLVAEMGKGRVVAALLVRSDSSAGRPQVSENDR